MILIEDTYWPLVVVGVYHGAPVDIGMQRLSRARWHSPEPRWVTLVVPGSGPEAECAQNALIRWLRRHVSAWTPVAGAAWVIPDPGVRGSVATLIDACEGTAFGAPSRTFGTVKDAIDWLEGCCMRVFPLSPAGF